MDSANSYDVLLVSPDPSARAAIGRSLKSYLTTRLSEHGSARSALASYSNARFDAIICDSQLTGPDCWCLLRMVRSGRFGFAETPAFVLAVPQELAVLSGIADDFTRVIDSKSPDDAVEQILRYRSSHRRARILLVEDEPDAAEAAERALNKYFHVEVCASAESALAAWRTHHHELILLDLMLPGMGGAELLPLILRERPSQPVIILTAYDAAESHQELMLSGAQDFLAKPNNMRELPGLCSRVLRDHAALESARQARSAAEDLAQVSDRLHAVNDTLRRGRTAEATMHLQRAMDVFRVSETFRSNAPEDDKWTTLVREFSLPPATAAK